MSASIAAACADLKVEIVREAEVKSINISDRRVGGVTLADGRVFESRVVASCVDAHVTFEKMIEPGHLPAAFRRAIAHIDYASASAKINLALAAPPSFTCLPSEGIQPQHHGTIHIGESLDYIERAYDDAKYGRPSEEPILEITIPTSVDRTIAPAGKHIMSMFVQYAPYKLAAGLHWDELKEAFADRCIDVLARYAPNIKDVIEHRQVLSPLDLERVYGLTGGNIMQGAMNLNQLFVTRPIPGWADYHTPIAGLYLCGAASHPGGGVMGACGKNAAQEINRNH